MIRIQHLSVKLKDTQNLFVMIEILMVGAFSYTRETIYHVENLAAITFRKELKVYLLNYTFVNVNGCFWAHHPPPQKHGNYFVNLSNALNMFISEYDNILLTGDFNTNESHVAMKNFLELFNLTNLVKENTRFK